MAKPNCYAVILAGGRGTRFWPRSRRTKSKQVLNVFGERTLIQETVERLRSVVPPERCWILTNRHLRPEIVRQLPEVPREQILAEPEQRNTAPAIGLAAHILCSIEPGALMGVFPSDHVILKPSRYRKFVRAAFREAARGNIGILGIAPRWAETGFGYIELPEGVEAGSTEPAPVLRFREKPDAETASAYVEAGRFFWNAGMFFWRAEVLLEALRKFQPKTFTLLSSLPAFSHRGFARKLAEVFPLCKSISIDYAVLERADNVTCLACDDIGWNDVGSWQAVYDLLARDEHGNSRQAEVLASDSRGNYVDAKGKLVALLGVNDLVVVDTPDALLIADRSRSQEVGDLVKLLEKRKREELL